MGRDIRQVLRESLKSGTFVGCMGCEYDCSTKIYLCMCGVRLFSFMIVLFNIYAIKYGKRDISVYKMIFYGTCFFAALFCCLASFGTIRGMDLREDTLVFNAIQMER